MNKTENYSNSTSSHRTRQRDEVLRDVMPQLGMEPTEPDDKFRVKTRRKRLISSLIVLCVVVAVVVALIVVLSMRCPFRSLEVAEEDYTSVTVDAEVGRTMLLDSVTAELNGKAVVADQQSSPGSFRIVALENGTLTVTARTVTGHETVQELTISGIDTEPPYLTNDEKIGNNIYIYLDDDESGVNWDTIEVTGIESGKAYARARADEEAGAVRVALPKASLRVWVEDMAGNHLSLRLDPITEADEAAGSAGTENADGTAGEDAGAGLASSPFASAP